MIEKTNLKAVAATIAVAVAGTGAALAATHGNGSPRASTGTATSAANGRPAGPLGGPAGGFGTDLAAAAAYLGTTRTKLQAQLRTGKTLAAIASSTSGKSTAGLIDAIVAAETKQLRRAQSAGTLTSAQLKQMLSGLAQSRPLVTAFDVDMVSTSDSPSVSAKRQPMPKSRIFTCCSASIIRLEGLSRP